MILLIALTNSTIGIIEMERRIAIRYSYKLRLTNEKAFDKKLISITATVRMKESAPAPNNHRLGFLILNMEFERDRILNE